MLPPPWALSVVGTAAAGRENGEHGGVPGTRRQWENGGSGCGAEGDGRSRVQIDGAARVVGSLPAPARPGPQRPVRTPPRRRLRRHRTLRLC